MRRFYLLLLLVFVLFISLTSVSYAYTLDDVFSYAEQLKDTIINNNAGSAYNNAFDFCYNKMVTNSTAFYNMFNQYYSTADSFSVNYYYSSATSYGVRISCFTGNTSVGHSSTTFSDGSYERCWVSGGTFLGSMYLSHGWGVERQPSTKADNFSCSSYSYNMPKGFYLVATGDYSATGYNGFFINGLTPPYTGPEFTVSTFNTTTIPIYANGQSENFQKLQFTTQMRLKDLGNITNFSEVYAIKGNFGPYVTDDIIDGSQSEFYYNKFGGTQNGSLVFYSDTGLVQIRTSKLIPKQGYNLNLAYQTEKNGEWTDFADVNFYALYYGDLSSSGDLVSPDLNSTVDIGFVRALDEFFNPTSGEISEASESIFQNPFGSGEFFGITYTDYDDWGFGDFVIGLFEGIYNIFNDFTDVSINFGFLGTVSSEAFITTGSVHNFLAIFTDAIFIIMMVFWYFRLVRAFSTFDLTAISKYDFDQMFNMF